MRLWGKGTIPRSRGRARAGRPRGGGNKKHGQYGSIGPSGGLDRGYAMSRPAALGDRANIGVRMAYVDETGLRVGMYASAWQPNSLHLLEIKLMPGWIAPVGVPAAILLLIGLGVWVGGVIERIKNIRETADADRKTFKETADADRKAFKETADADRETFQKAITEDRKRFRTILDDIKKIFHRLGQVETTFQSPLRLTDYGRELLAGIGGEPWATRLATTLRRKVEGMEAYEIHEFCFEYVANDLDPSDDEQVAMRRTAYEKGAEMEQIQRVLAIELRDRLLTMTNQEAVE